MLSKVHRGALGGGSGEENKLRREGGKPTPEDWREFDPCLKKNDSSHVECLLFQMVDYHESEGARGASKKLRGRSSQQ